MINTLFRVNDGEIGVGGKPFLGHLRHFIIMFDTFPTAFFIATDDQFNRALGDKTAVFKRF